MINDEGRLTDPHCPYQGICSPLPSPVVLLFGQHNSVSPCGAHGPCSNPAVLKCPRTEQSKNCHPAWSSLLGSFPVGPPGPPDRCEHWVDIDKHAPYFHRAKYEAAKRPFCLVPTPRRTLLCSLSSAICRFIYRFFHKAECDYIYTEQVA